MVARSADEAIANARAYKTNRQGMCLKYTRTWLGIGSYSLTAKAAWNAAKHKHAGDHTPPKGAPVFWSGGSRGFGHIALSVSSTHARSTDTTSPTHVGEVDLDWFANNWHQTYLGWTEDLNGVLIPWLSGGGDSSGGNPWAKGDVYCSKLHHGQQDSDSVRRLQYRLAVRDIDPTIKTTGNYNDKTKAAVKKWQHSIGETGSNADGNMGPMQAEQFFGSNYTVIDDT